MNTYSFMPRYGTLEHRRIGFLLFAALLIAFAMLTPQVALAAFDGSFGPDKNMVTNVNKSFTDWWKTIAVWGMWISAFAVLLSVLVFGGKFWWIPVCTALICLFAESFINGVKGFMG